LSRRTRRRLIAAPATLLLVASPAQAAAVDRPLPSDAAAVDAYRESVPTSVGPQPTGIAGRRASLEASQRANLARVPGAAGRLLRDVATSPAYGAPVGRLRAAQALDERDTRASAADAALLPLRGDASELRLGLLGALLILIAAVAVAMRLTRPPTD
jgi:hypothetical protein